jgi:hypothetical protein
MLSDRGTARFQRAEESCPTLRIKPGRQAGRSEPVQLSVFIILVARQRKAAGDSIVSHKPLEQRGGKLDGFAGGTLDHDIADAPPVVFQVLLGRDVELEFESVHDGVRMGRSLGGPEDFAVDAGSWMPFPAARNRNLPGHRRIAQQLEAFFRFRKPGACRYRC